MVFGLITGLLFGALTIAGLTLAIIFSVKYHTLDINPSRRSYNESDEEYQARLKRLKSIDIRNNVLRWICTGGCIVFLYYYSLYPVHSIRLMPERWP